MIKPVIYEAIFNFFNVSCYLNTWQQFWGYLSNNYSFFSNNTSLYFLRLKTYELKKALQMFNKRITDKTIKSNSYGG